MEKLNWKWYLVESFALAESYVPSTFYYQTDVSRSYVSIKHHFPEVSSYRISFSSVGRKKKQSVYTKKSFRKINLLLWLCRNSFVFRIEEGCCMYMQNVECLELRQKNLQFKWWEWNFNTFFVDLFSRKHRSVAKSILVKINYQISRNKYKFQSKFLPWISNEARKLPSLITY